MADRFQVTIHGLVQAAKPHIDVTQTCVNGCVVWRLYESLFVCRKRFLIAISIELIAQGLGAKISEQVFNGLMIIALGTAVVYQMRYTGPDEPSSQPG